MARVENEGCACENYPGTSPLLVPLVSADNTFEPRVTVRNGSSCSMDIPRVIQQEAATTSFTTWKCAKRYCTPVQFFT